LIQANFGNHLPYRPSNKEELFNLQHASVRNIIECIFSILKHHFRILLLLPAYAMELQAQIPTALCTVHNFICMHDPTNIPTNEADDEDDDEDWQGEYSGGNDDDKEEEEEAEENDDIVAIEEDNKIEFYQ
jgi:hypothetical protein